MSSGLKQTAKGADSERSSRTVFWPAVSQTGETPVPEGTGLLWLQEKMPSWRWYVEQAREPMQQ